MDWTQADELIRTMKAILEVLNKIAEEPKAGKAAKTKKED